MIVLLARDWSIQLGGAFWQNLSGWFVSRNRGLEGSFLWADVSGNTCFRIFSSCQLKNSAFTTQASGNGSNLHRRVAKSIAIYVDGHQIATALSFLAHSCKPSACQFLRAEFSRTGPNRPWPYPHPSVAAHILRAQLILCKFNVAVGKHLFTACCSLFLYWARSRSISLQESKKGATAHIQHACHSTNRHDCTRRYISTCLPKECLWFTGCEWEFAATRHVQSFLP